MVVKRTGSGTNERNERNMVAGSATKSVSVYDDRSDLVDSRGGSVTPVRAGYIFIFQSFKRILNLRLN